MKRGPCFSTGATAQNEPAGQQAENVVISATRMTAAGFNAPTPTTVVGSEFLFPRLCGALCCIALSPADALPVLEIDGSAPLRSRPQLFETKLEILREQKRFATKDARGQAATTGS